MNPWLTAATLFVSLLTAADYSGRYDGAFESAAGAAQKVTAVIHQQGDRITGSIGPSPQQQIPWQDGQVANGQLTASIAELGGLVMTFPEAGETLTGSLKRRDGKPPMFDRLVLRRTGPLTVADLVPPLPNEGGYRSTQIAQLRQDLERNPNALTEFWQSVKQSGTPLIEPDPSGPSHHYATFLWQGKPEHKNVMILWMPFTNAKPSDFLMVNLPNTDLWFRTLRIPKGARMQYHLSPNDPLATMPPSTTRLGAVKDPLNPKAPLFELPNASPQPYYGRRDDVPKMQKHEHSLPSAHLKQERKFLVYTPPGYDPKAKPYPSIYFFDGEDPDGLVFATWTFENLFAERKIPPMIVIRIVNPNQNDRRMLAAQDPFFDFLSTELVPYIRSNYNVSANPAETAISGYSLGGFAAAYAGLRHSNQFGLILSQSGSYWYEPTQDDNAEPTWLAQKFIAAPRLPLRFYMDAGLFEVDLSGRGRAILLPNRHLRDVLKSKGYEVTCQEFPGGHDYINWRGTLVDGLLALFR